MKRPVVKTLLCTRPQIHCLSIFCALWVIPACAENNAEPQVPFSGDAGDASSATDQDGSLGDTGVESENTPQVSLSDTQIFISKDKEGSPENIEAEYTCPEGSIVTGFGARAWAENITTLRVRCQDVNPDGTLGSPTEHRAGSEPDEGLEANLDLGEAQAMTGVGARGIEFYDVGKIGAWARRIETNGTLGTEEIITDGKATGDSFEREYKVDDGRVIVGLGLRMSSHDIAGLKVVSQRWELSR
ncbi:MAG: hypothetical protein IPJ88_04990 [Myxococcales bacterium]|nr:MAG: hypothetical protein IPJ88_04990 [Myxococcales bacterium]